MCDLQNINGDNILSCFSLILSNIIILSYHIVYIIIYSTTYLTYRTTFPDFVISLLAIFCALCMYILPFSNVIKHIVSETCL